MKFLLDTQIAIWALIDDPRLNQPARKILDSSANQFQFSVGTIWEIAIKRGLKRAGFQYDPREVRRHLLLNGCKELTIQSRHLVEVDSLPLIHPQGLKSTYAVVFAQNSSKARTSSPAICWAVDCSMTKRCIR